ncbi:hypothetical protein OSTOST_21896 [Ostertagia ostertagi]
MRVNVARVWEDADYARVKNMCETSQGWQEVYKKKSISIFTQSVPCSNYHMIKAVAKYTDVQPSVAYDVLHDSTYRFTLGSTYGSTVLHRTNKSEQ